MTLRKCGWCGLYHTHLYTKKHWCPDCMDKWHVSLAYEVEHFCRERMQWIRTMRYRNSAYGE